MAWFLTVCNLLVPLVMIGFGWVWQKRPPREINSVYGYRTARSMQNRETWEFAHQLVGRLWFRLGWVLAGLTAGFSVLCYGMPGFEVGVLVVQGLQVITLIVTIPITERKLQLAFDRYGCRRPATGKRRK